MFRTTIRSRLPLLLPVFVFIAVFWAGLGAWYQQDDFAHLQMAASTTLADLPGMLARPIAQGTFRPLSERLFYWVLWHTFGLDALPARIFCFVLQAGNCVLLGMFLLRRTGSVWGAALGATAWAVQPALALPMTWVATTNQVLWAFCVLAALTCFARNRMACAWVFYLLGFGVLESNVVVPALITLFAWPRWRAAIPFWVPAILFAAVHALWIPKAASGTYGMYLDWQIFATAWTYWRWVWTAQILAVGMLVAGMAIGRFGLAWFILALGPMLLLREHRTDYYLTVPAMGIAFLFASAWSRQPACTALVLAGYFAVSVPAAWRAARIQVEKSLDMQALVLGVGQAQQRNPGKIVLLDGITDGVFWSGVYDNPFVLAGAPGTKLTPEAGAKLTPYPGLFRAEDYTHPVVEGKTVVYRFSNRMLRETPWAVRPSPPSRVAVALPQYEVFLGREWFGPEDGFRWMPGRATVVLEGAGRELRVDGFCVEAQAGLRVGVRWEGQPLGEQAVAGCAKDFTLTFPLPAGRAARGTVTVVATPVIHVGGDERDLGLAVRTVEIR